MKDPTRLLVIAVGLVAGLCTVFMTLARGLGHDVSKDIKLELDVSDPTTFTVVAVAPYELRLMGPQGVTLRQAEELRSRLAGVAEMGLVSIRRSSAANVIIRNGKSEVIKPPVYYIGVDDVYFRVMDLPLAEGRPFTAEEVASGKRVCVVGHERPETSYHSDPEGGMSAVYTVTGRLVPVDGDPYPLPKIWSHDDPQFPFAMNLVVLTPITARAPLPWPHAMGIEEPETFAVPLVQPFPGKYEEAVQIVSAFMERLWPGWALDFGVANRMQATLGNAGGQVEAFFSHVGHLLLALFLVSTAGLMVLHVSRARRDLAIHRAVGASRSQVLVMVLSRGAAAAVIGAVAGLGFLAALRPLLGAYLGRDLTVDLGTAASDLGLVVLAALAAAAATTVWATTPEPAQALHKGSASVASPLLDVRVLLAGAAVMLALGVVTALLIAGRASVATLQGYLRSAGERAVIISQDLALAERNLTRSDLLGPEHADVLRQIVPSDWEGVYQASAPVTIYRAATNPVAVFAYGIDRLWPDGEGFAHAPDIIPGWGDGAGSPTALVGNALAGELFGAADPVGRVLDLAGGLKVTIGGVISPRPADVVDPLGDRDMALVLPDEVFERLPEVRAGQATRQVVFYVPPGQDTSAAADLLETALKERGLTEIGLKAEAVVDRASSLRTLTSRMNGLQLILAWMALATTTLMAGVTAHSQVFERRREYGIKRAVGAPPWRVVIEVVAVSVGVGLVFSLAGAGVGTFVGQRICRSQGWLVVDCRPALVLAAACALAASLVASLWPVSVVAGEQPLTALREGD